MFGSTVAIIQALSNGRLSPSPELTQVKKLIYVPQKCYGMITPATDRSIRGLYTTGLNTCSGIVIHAHDPKNQYVFLCHADDQTSLYSPLHGLASWIKSIPEEIPISIEFDNISESGYAVAIYDITRSMQATRSITVSPKNPGATDILVLRNGQTLREGGIHFEYFDQGYERVSSDIAAYIQNIFEYFGDSYHPPICVFNGMTVLNKEEIEQEQAWVRRAADYQYEEVPIPELATSENQGNSTAFTL